MKINGKLQCKLQRTPEVGSPLSTLYIRVPSELAKVGQFVEFNSTMWQVVDIYK